MPIKKPTTNRAKELLEALVEAVVKPGPSARGTAVHNCLLLSLGGQEFPSRARKLREYTLAMMEPLLQHADGVKTEDGKAIQAPILTHEELVMVLLAGALLVQSDRVLGRNIQ